MLMQSYPGGIQAPWIITERRRLDGTETTIRRTLQPHLQVASRIRSRNIPSNIDVIVESLTSDSNGLYTNEWLLAMPTPMRSPCCNSAPAHHLSPQQNRGSVETPGFYWGCNNTKDIEVRLETLASRQTGQQRRGGPSDDRCGSNYREHKARSTVLSPETRVHHAAAGRVSLPDAKYTTTDWPRPSTRCSARRWAARGNRRTRNKVITRRSARW